MTTAQATVSLTPAMLAEAFWKLGSDEQAEFFQRLADVVKADHQGGNTSAYALGELQWFYLGDELFKNKPARDMLMTMAAPLYLNTIRYCEARQ